MPRNARPSSTGTHSCNERMHLVLVNYTVTTPEEAQAMIDATKTSTGRW